MLNRQNSLGAMRAWLQQAALWVPAAADLCTPKVHALHWRVTGARGWAGQSCRGKWVTASDVDVGAVKSCWSLTVSVTDNNHRELWSLISAAAWLRQNGAP